MLLSPAVYHSPWQVCLHQLSTLISFRFLPPAPLLLRHFRFFLSAFSFLYLPVHSSKFFFATLISWFFPNFFPATLAALYCTWILFFIPYCVGDSYCPLLFHVVPWLLICPEPLSNLFFRSLYSQDFESSVLIPYPFLDIFHPVTLFPYLLSHRATSRCFFSCCFCNCSTCLIASFTSSSPVGYQKVLADCILPIIDTSVRDFLCMERGLKQPI